MIEDLKESLTDGSSTDYTFASPADITRLEQTERALRESEQKYRDLFDNAGEIIFSVDKNGNFISANNSALKTYGFSKNEITSVNFRQIIDPSSRNFIINLLTDQNSSIDSSRTFELLTRTRAGDPVRLEVVTRLIRKDNRVEGFEGIGRDITERKLQQEELEESRGRFKEIADLLPGIICEMDMSFRFTYVNEMGLKTFGYTHENFENGINAGQMISSDLHSKFETDMYNMLHGDFGNPVQYKLLKKDGQIVHAIINSAPIYKGNTIRGIRTCIIDITDRVKAEEKLKFSEERFRTIFAESPIGIALFTINGDLIEMNRSFRRMFDFQTEQKIDFHPVINDLLELTIEETLRLGESQGISKEVEVEGPGEKKWFDWNVTPIGSGENISQVLLAQVQDITERKLAHEERLRKEKEAVAKAEALIIDLRRELREQTSFHNMVSRSHQMKQIFDILPEVSLASATVLITGDSGTGKELIARTLHELGSRKNKPFTAINCSALPDNLLESELFGYKAGAFTDAKKDKPGKFAAAEGGTIFLDEIGDISSAMQVKLLRVLQEKVYEPLGGNVSVKANVRVIAATNKNLEEMVKDGIFREDLYYRINIVTVKLPPLRERRCDIPLLCEHFIECFNSRYGKDLKGVSQEAMQILLSYDFPGNIRELENIIEHAFIFCKESLIDTIHLPDSIRTFSEERGFNSLSKIGNFDDLERMYLKSVLKECGGSRIKTAQKLGIHKATLFRKLKQHGIR